MNFHQLTLPIPKRLSADSSLKVFPVDQILNTDDEKPFTGIYTGLSVEITDADAIKLIHSGGCFGLSTKTKNIPQILSNLPRVRNVKQAYYEQKIAWNAQFTNQNLNLVMVHLLPENDEESIAAKEQLEKFDTQNEVETIAEGEKSEQNDEVLEDPEDESEKMEIAEERKEPEQNLVVDPFPIEETLALLPEEAFFLHFSLRCLRVLNFDQTHEFTTEELLSEFCDCDTKFIERFIVYHYYRAKNWVVKSGLKFGGDFLLYYKGPSYYHASYVVLVCDNNDEPNHLDVQSNYRVAESTNKEIILANVTRPDGLEYSNRMDCLKRLKEFTITEILPKRFLLNQLTTFQQKS